MKYLSLKVLIFCIIIPPVFYIASIIFLESYLEQQYKSDIENMYTGDTFTLLSGNIRLKDAMNENIDRYLTLRKITWFGVMPNVTVITKQGTILYPSYFENDDLELDPIYVARENLKLMNEGFSLNIDLEIKHNTVLSNLILGFYIVLTMCVLSIYYRLGIKRVRIEVRKRDTAIDKLLQKTKRTSDKIKVLEHNRQHLASELDTIRSKLENEKQKASRNEDDMIEEIETLEKKISEDSQLQEKQQREIEQLKEKLARYETQKTKKQRIKSIELFQKRFKTLYKSTICTKKALEGFSDLTDDLKLKCEEIIHQLNMDPSLVPIKRKVFGKKNRETVLEVLFGYKGRIYYRIVKENTVELLVIGTKNTQNKDLEFLDSL